MPTNTIIALGSEKIRALLENLNRQIEKPWQYNEHSLHKEFVFVDFAEAFAFMTRCALLAERANHHPDWHNVYNRVNINLMTHDVNGVSVKDFELIQAIEELTL